MDRNRQPVGKQRQYNISKLGEPYWRERIPKDYVFYTQETAACREANNNRPTRLVGGRELLIANFRNLAVYLDAGGVKVRAWSFFSGELPYAEMMYQAKQDPEDVLDLAVIPSLSELRKERKLQFQEEKLHYRPYGLGSVYENGAQVYLIDDMPSFEAEMMARRGFDARTTDALLKSGINFIYAGDSELLADKSRIARIVEFEGKRQAYSRLH